MSLIFSNVYVRGYILATTEGSGITIPPAVTVIAPVASFTASTSLVGNLVDAVFTDTSTNTPTSWAWNFGDGFTSTLQNPTHLFESVGTFNVTVTATNSAGSSTSAAQTFTVLAPDIAPVASFTKSKTTGATPLSVVFTDTSSNGPTSWLWNFGDGQTSTSQNPTHIYATAGSFNVTLTATDAVGSNTSAAQSIVAVTAPVASFTKSVASGNAPLSVTFTDTSTNTPTSWLWNFGDGFTSTVQNPVHSFGTAGSYNVTLTATNSAGANTSGAQVVTAQVKTYATWGTTSNGNIVLSGGNLLARRNATASPTTSVMSSIGKSAGKWYYEITRSNGAGAPVNAYAGPYIGGCAGTLPADYGLGSNATSFAWWTPSAYQYFKKYNVVISGALATLANNATVGCALDMDAKTLTIYTSSGVVLGTFTGITGTTIYPAVGMYYVNEGVLANFGASPFQFTVPSGYNPGLYNVA